VGALPAGGVHVVAKAGAAVGQRLSQHLPDSAVEPPRLDGGEAIGGLLWVDPGNEEGLIGIDVADASDGLLVKEDGLYRRRTPLEDPLEGPGAEARVQGLRTESTGNGAQIPYQPHGAKLAQVHKAEPGAVIQPEGRPQVTFTVAGPPTVEELPGHAQVDGPRAATVQHEEEELAATLQVLDAPASESAAELFARWALHEARSIGRDPGLEDGTPADQRQEVTADGLDFGELGHPVSPGA